MHKGVRELINQSLAVLVVKREGFEGGFGNRAIIAGFVAREALIIIFIKKVWRRERKSVLLLLKFFSVSSVFVFFLTIIFNS